MNATMQECLVRNGVDVAALAATLDAVKGTPALARFVFRASNRWMGGDRNRSTIEDFYGTGQELRHASPLVMDNAEPPVLLGGDSAANPVEYVLHALIGCLTTTMVYHAAARGIEIASVESRLEGDLDLRGFLGLSTEVRKGFSKVRVRMTVDSTASMSTLRELAQHSPVFDIVSNSLPVELTVERA